MARTALRRLRVTVAASSILGVSTLAGCSVRTVPSTAAAPLVATVAAFEAFSGMPLPAHADHLVLRASTDERSEPSYLVALDLPTDEIDRFSAAGRLDRTLHITTVSARLRSTFGYHGDSSEGVRWTAGSLPSDMAIQRELFAVGTFTGTAHVQVHAYRMGR